MYSWAEWILLCVKVNREFCKGERKEKTVTVKNFISLIISW